MSAENDLKFLYPWYSNCDQPATTLLLGGLGGVVNFFDFCPALLKSLGCFDFQCVLSSQWKAVTVNLQIFTLPTLKAFLEARSQNVSSNKQYLAARAIGSPKMHFFHEILIFWSAKKWCKDTFFPTLHPLSLVIFATATEVAFVLLHNSRFNFHCYTQREATPTQKSARKWHCDFLQLLVWKMTKGIHSCKPDSLNRPVLTWNTIFHQNNKKNKKKK